MQVALAEFLLISPVMYGMKHQDAYFDTAHGEDAMLWVRELVWKLGIDGLPDPSGWPRLDRDRLAVTGVSLGGALTYMIGTQCNEVLSCVAPVAGYHSPERCEALAEGLAKLPVFCVHSISHTEKTCPIDQELPLWERIRGIKGSRLEVKEVYCKHGKTFSHAYEIDADVWSWVLQQRRRQSGSHFDEAHTSSLIDVNGP